MNRQLINLAGVLLSVLVLIVGVFAFALPLFVQAEATSGDTDAVLQTNATHQQVIDALHAQQEKSGELEEDIADLRAQIPGTPHTDDVVFLAISAAQRVGGQVTAVTATAVEPFAPRPAPADDGSGLLQTPATPQTDAAAPTADTPDETPSVDGEVPADGTQPADGAAPAPTASAPANSGRMQLPMTIEMTVPSVEAATSAIDALRRGPRLIAVTSATTTSSDAGVTLSVSVLAFLDNTVK